MKRIIILLILFALLGGATAWYLNKDTDQSESMAQLKAERDFAVNPDEVYKIFIADRKGERTTMEQKKGVWL